MGAVSNALSLHKTGLVPYCATFTIFTDYMRNSIRLSALAEAGTIFVTTHDSVAVGEDGPTHQPIETIPSLRMIPNLTVIRPADANVFGASAPGGTCLDKFGFNAANVVACAGRCMAGERGVLSDGSQAKQ